MSTSTSLITTAIAAALTAASLFTMPIASAGPVQEDDPGWSCITMGNRVCGLDNSNGVTPGCYDDTSTLVAPWPCHVVVNPDGSSDVYA